MKHSIRVKFTMIFIGLMAAVLVSMWAVNSFFLESFYTKQKLQLLENAYENLNAIAVDKICRACTQTTGSRQKPAVSCGS